MMFGKGQPLFRLTLRRREMFTGYLFLSPWVIGFIVFLVGPMIASLYLGFTRYDMVNPPTWVGVGNYARMFNDRLFYLTLRVTAQYTIASVPLLIVTALAVALLLNQKNIAPGLFRTVYYLPSLISGVAVAIVFTWILNYRFGILNYALSLIGIRGPNWLGDPTWTLWAFVLMSIWGIGGDVVLFLAALQGVPKTLYEAAEIDGAGTWRRFWSITIPWISPVLLFALIMSVIGTFQTFTQSFVMTAGGPANSTYFYLLYLYRNAFNWFEMGYASALAWFLFLLILALTLIMLRTSAKWVYYAGATERSS